MEQPVLVWRGEGHVFRSQDSFGQEAKLYGLEQWKARKDCEIWRIPDKCPFCLNNMISKDYAHDVNFGRERDHYDRCCTFCGYNQSLTNMLHYSATDMKMELGPYNVKDQVFTHPILKSFDINDLKLPFEELGAWLAKNPDDLYSLHWRRFEELVEDVFKNMGYRTRLTQGSKDGGVDIFLLEHDGSQAIVQVKRNLRHRKVGVELVDQVRGLKLRPANKDVVKAYIVTSSSFTRGAKELAVEKPIITEFELELIGSHELLRQLETYNGQVANFPEHVRKRFFPSKD